MFHLGGISCRDQSLTFSVIRNQRPSTAWFRAPDRRNIQNLTEPPRLHMFHFLFRKSSRSVQIFWQRRASILHVTLHHGCEKLFTMTNVRKASGKFTRDLKECLLMFKSSNMSYFPGVTDCVGVCVCGGGGSWFCFFTMFHRRSCLSCEITLLQISFYLLLSAAVIIQWQTRADEHKSHTHSLGRWCDLNS